MKRLVGALLLSGCSLYFGDDNVGGDPTPPPPPVSHDGYASPVAYHTDLVDTIALADLDGDGSLDVVEKYRGYSTTIVLLNHGDGTFDVPRRFDTGPLGGTFVVGDVDGDGVLDLVVANGFGTTASILHGRGDGSFVSPRSMLLAATTSDASDINLVTLGDLDGDGQLDLVAALQSQNEIVVAPDLAVSSAFKLPELPATAIALADTDNDGRADLLVADGNTIEIARGHGDGSFEAIERLTKSWNPIPTATTQPFAVGDVNGDGRADIVVAGTANLEVFEAETHRLAQTFNYFHPYAIALGQLDGAGPVDAAVTIADTGMIQLYAGSSEGLVPGEALTIGGRPAALAIGDLNGDGLADLVVADENDASHGLQVILHR